MADDETQLECQDTQIEGNIKKIIEDNGFVEDHRVAAAEARSNEAEARANEAEARANEAEARTKKIFTRAKEVEEGFHAKCKTCLVIDANLLRLLAKHSTTIFMVVKKRELL